MQAKASQESSQYAALVDQLKRQAREATQMATEARAHADETQVPIQREDGGVGVCVGTTTRRRVEGIRMKRFFARQSERSGAMRRNQIL